MSPKRKKALRYLILAFLCGIGFFTSIFTQVVPFYTALGSALLSLVGFWMCFNRGYSLWGASVLPGSK